MTVDIVCVGLGPVGAGALAAALQDDRFSVTACVEQHQNRESLARAAGYEGVVLPSVSELHDGGVAVVCTSSAVTDIAPLASELVAKDFDVVTTCEELISPALADPSAVEALDKAGLTAGRTIIAAGVNPGFVMDVLPALATLPVRAIEQVRILRRVDVAQRRRRLQEKVGMGITVEEFESRRKRNAIGHVGLRASLSFLASAFGIDGVCEEQLEPVVDWDGRHSRGVRHIATVVDASGRTRIRGLLEMYGGAVDLDRVEVDGMPPLTLEISPGLFGDTATVSAVLNTAAAVTAMPSGLRTLADVPPPIWTEAAQRRLRATV